MQYKGSDVERQTIEPVNFSLILSNFLKPSLARPAFIASRTFIFLRLLHLESYRHVAQDQATQEMTSEIKVINWLDTASGTPPTHLRHTADQKTGRLKVACCKREIEQYNFSWSRPQCYEKTRRRRGLWWSPGAREDNWGRVRAG